LVEGDGVDYVADAVVEGRFESLWGVCVVRKGGEGGGKERYGGRLVEGGVIDWEKEKIEGGGGKGRN
jgi:hypothetical protein